MSSQGPLKLDSFPDPGDRFKLEEVIRVGCFGKTYIAKDTEASDKQVVVKIQEITPYNEKYLKDEYKLLRDVSSHPNIVDFYGIYCLKNELMLVTEYCEGGNVLDMVNELLSKNRCMREEHIAHILKEVIKAVSYLHEKHIIHRDLRASNIFITKNGEVKVAGFGLCITLASTFGRSSSAIGSPAWMAPESIQATNGDEISYDNRYDVWSLGMTAIELGDGKTPFKDMHPTRILFHVVRNPPPTLYRTSNWSENYNDFVAECLVKNPEHRPYMAELLGHPFLEEVPENNYHLTTELLSLLDSTVKTETPQDDVHVLNNVLWEGEIRNEEPMYVEDLAALDDCEEKNVLSHIERRFNDGKYQTFVGEILITLNPNVEENIYTDEHHARYKMKSKSDNIPHIYAIADSAYQNALHHVVPQKIILSGESGSGKTKNFLNLIDHLLFIGHNMNIQMSRIRSAIDLIHAFTHASTPYNDFSTRCVLRTDLSYGRTGKVTGASFLVNLLEKTRVSSTDMHQANFNIFYYVYDGLVNEDLAEDYKLDSNRGYRYLRVLEEERAERPRVAIEKNILKFNKIKDILREFEFTNEEREAIFKSLSAILILGEVRFQEREDERAEISNIETAKTVAQLLDTNEKKFCWALTNYCLLKDGAVVSRKNTCDEARDTRDVLANNIYSRLVDYVVARINQKLVLGKAIFGEKYLIQLLDYSGFECFKTNELWQLFINIFNEQMQHYYVQRIFKWEMADLNEDNIEYEPITFYNNQKVLDTLLGRSDGIFSIIGQASKLEYNGKYITEFISNMDCGHITTSKHMEFSISHYTGTLNYNAKEMPDKNRDFLPPEIIETMRSSNNSIVKTLFSGKLNKCGNLILEFEEEIVSQATLSPTDPQKGINANKFSQSKKLRTLATIFKAVCLETLTALSTGSTSGGTHFVRCIKTNLKAKPNHFCRELVKQQIRAMAIPQTAKIRKEGYAYRIQFAEFLKRYQFLAFDFDENVEITPDNCRLLLIRLKMEGWLIGKKRVFLKYYNEEYLSRLYEYQVKKIIKIQSILRGFLAKCRMKKNSGRSGKEGAGEPTDQAELTEEEAAQVIQKAYRRRAKKDQTDEGGSKSGKDFKLMKKYGMRWKRSSFLHLLFKMKSKKIFDTFNLSIQTFIFNQNAMANLDSIASETVDLSDIDTNCTKPPWAGKSKPLVMKINYKWNEIPFHDTSDMLLDKTSLRLIEEYTESWDKPYHWRGHSMMEHNETQDEKTEEANENLINLQFSRNPEDKLEKLEDSEEHEVKIQQVEELKRMKNTRNEITYKQCKSPKKENISISMKPSGYKNNYILDNTQPANKDFDYIKAPVLSKVRGPDPIAELKSIGRRDSANDDSPPFNFQGMLRKTNFKRDSMKAVVNVRRFSLRTQEQDHLAKQNEINQKHEHISLELGPQLLLEGTLYDI
ncbi:neither inactivation nor afterpotential protein C [Coccinella septempunctata]|uniref:neither inactivation nor afterpotential protein C n=1 Tax=Coccinella septempunctata TaxID=41139 RepID=UPI001D0966D6|nr:neither inactivation nor afterpotential protein C [Coccinella septempunctata]XP_044750971.1 neither inactivation nor afterpotential protein C [Coccinella septempunctata]